MGGACDCQYDAELGDVTVVGWSNWCQHGAALGKGLDVLRLWCGASQDRGLSMAEGRCGSEEHRPHQCRHDTERVRRSTLG